MNNESNEIELEENTIKEPIEEEKLKEEFELFIEEREKFVSGFSPKDDQAWKCEKHNIWIGRNMPCPECEYEKNLEKISKEIIESKMFGKQNGNVEEQIKKADQIKSSLLEKSKKNNEKHNKIKTKRYKIDKTFRDHQKEASKKSNKKSRIRKLEHSLDI